MYLPFMFCHSCLNWGLIVLWCCIGFCCTTKWISYMYTYIPSFWNLPPTSKESYPSRSPQWYRWTYLQGKNGDTGVENGCVDMQREWLVWTQTANEDWLYSGSSSVQCSGAHVLNPGSLERVSMGNSGDIKSPDLKINKWMHMCLFFLGRGT